MQAITGIPYFYRQFGYEMTLTLGGSRQGYQPHIPQLKDDQTEPYKIRPATPEDIPFIAKMYDHGRKRSLISCLRSKDIWQYEMMEQHETFRSDMCIVETLDEKSIGFIWHNNKLHNSNIGLFFYELKPEISWADVTPTVIRYLKQKGEAYASQEDDKEWHSYTFNFGKHHPAYDAASKYLPQENPPYAWYIRIPDLPDFIQHIGPVINRRLAASEFANYGGELLLDFHRSGIKLKIESGELTSSDSWQPTTETRGDLAFPDLTFLHLVCGHRTFEELENFYPDCYRREKPEAPALVNALFPKMNSSVLGIV